MTSFARMAVLLCALGLTPALLPASTQAQTAGQSFVKPPRTINDITAILDQQKPDPTRAAAARAAADVEPPAGADNRSLVTFHFQRGVARNEIGRLKDAIADVKRAAELGEKETVDLNRIQTYLVVLYSNNSEPHESLKLLQKMQDALKAQQGGQGRLFFTQRQLAVQNIVIGNMAEAEKWIARNDDLYRELSGNSKTPAVIKLSWERDVVYGRARLAQARGNLKDAEQGYAKAIAVSDDMIAQLKSDDSGLRAPTLAFRDNMLGSLAQVKTRQGRMAEAEADTRIALLSRLKAVGKYSTDTAATITGMSRLLSEQGRYAEAEKMALTVVDILGALGTLENARVFLTARNNLAIALGFMNRWKEAAEQYRLVDAAAASLPPDQAKTFTYLWGRLNAYSITGAHDEAIALGEQMVASNVARLGDKNAETALTRGYLALAQLRAKKFDQAEKNFKEAVPILASASRASDDDDESGAGDVRARVVIENHIAMEAARRGTDPVAAAETFRLADRIRGNVVNKALAASSARAAAKDPALADLARKEQDLEKAIAAQFGGLNNALALPPEQRDDNALRSLRGQIDKMRTERASVRQEIEKKFPDYAALIDPRPPTVDEIKASLRPGEAFLSVFLGATNSFVWAVPKDGPIAFTSAPVGAKQIEDMVNKLRLALEPKAETLEEIPAFDLATAHELYKMLLQPIEAAWKPSKTLVFTTNGALGLLPLGLLPTAPTQLAQGGVMFEGYKAVPWLAKTHAVAMIPSASALKTLRNLPVASKNRQTLIGFGDPFFSVEQAKEAGVQVASSATATRGTPLKRRNAPQTNGVDSAELALLPRLPDTSDELKSIALALQSDPAKVLFLGKEANERRVKTTNLSGFKIVAFATHGLVPGELDGLTQPALALSAPAVAGIDGDGLLTMEDILSLKLDADWVVLSACNTGAGSGAGAEAASGLGRAFFYAGTRALLVTNWSVHSVSARELVTDLFARQAKNAGISRAEALREAMAALMEGPGYVEGGKSQFSYAHPLFWAPYSLIGDGGGG